MRLGFIGLGHIGGPMARLLAASKNEVTVYDVFPKAAESFQGKAKIAASPAEVGRNAEIVGICVRDDQQVRETLEGPNGLLAGLAKGALVLVHSTIKSKTVRALAADAKAKGIDLIDAPVSRARRTDDTPFIACMVGGEPAQIERARPVLELFSVKIVHAGKLGCGSVTKACNNLVTYIEFVAAHEAFKLAVADGVDPKVLREIMTENGNLTPSMQALVDQKLSRPPGPREESAQKMMDQMVALGIKDLGVALSLAEDLHLSLPTTALVQGLIREAWGG